MHKNVGRGGFPAVIYMWPSGSSVLAAQHIFQKVSHKTCIHVDCDNNEYMILANFL